MEQGWDYNDEIFFSSEGGHPEKFFSSEEEADKAADEANLKEFKRLVKSGEIREYGYSMDDIIDGTDEDLMFQEGIFMTVFGKTAEDWWEDYRGKDNVKGEPTEEQWKKLMSCFNLNFYDVVEVKKG